MLSGFGNVALMRIVPVFGSISRSAARNVPRLRVDAAVGEDQRQRRRRLPTAPWPPRAVDPAGHLQVLLLAQREVGLDRIDLRHGRQQRRRADQIADLRGGDRGDAVDRAT